MVYLALLLKGHKANLTVGNDPDTPYLITETPDGRLNNQFL